MSKYIKKEDAIKYLNDLFGEMHHVSFDDALQSIDRLQTYSFPDTSKNKGEWIPVSERLPEDGAWAIFTDGSTISVERYKADAIDHFFPEGRWFSLDEAIAWMPLPEPYKAESEEV